MILYFSGTGNSRIVARQLGFNLRETLRFIPENDPETLVFKGESLGIVCPVYAWGIPPIVVDFLRRLNRDFVAQVRSKKIPVWGVLTCGDDTGKAPEMLAKALEYKNIRLRGCWSVQMPNVYVLLPGFGVDPKVVETAKLEAAKVRVSRIAAMIKRGCYAWDCTEGSMPALKTRLVYPLFKKWGINPKKWNVSDDCVSCGRCAEACPVHNIELKEGRPQWGDNCLSCTACYHSCPRHAINYGSITRKQGQYNFNLR